MAEIIVENVEISGAKIVHDDGATDARDPSLMSTFVALKGHETSYTVFDTGEYSVEAPNQETIDAIMDSEGDRDMVYFETVDDLFKDLHDD